MQIAGAVSAGLSAAPHPVVQVLLERARSGSRPGARLDPYRVGLVVEGGAMRGIVAAGMVVALEALGLRDAFDAVYGASAGACVGAYFLAQQAYGGARLYYEAVNTRRFIDPLRGLRRRPVIDLDHLFDDVLRARLPLDFEAVQRSEVELVVLASPVDAATPANRPLAPARLTGFASADDLLDALHASARVAVIGGPPVPYRDGRYWDGAIIEPIPVWTALADGCTHVLALLTLPRGAPAQRIHPLDRLLVAPRVAALSPALGRMYLSRSTRYHATRREVFARHDAQNGPPYVAVVAKPPWAPEIGRTELRADRLIAGARAGGNAALRTFGRADAWLDADLQMIWDVDAPARRAGGRARCVG